MADVTDAEFETAVVERSKTVPVIIDLWAPWCGPCTTLTPILEKVIGETKGLVELAKVNVDENPAIYTAFQVQGIPAVFAMLDGRVVDGFMSAQPEHVVVEFVQRVLDMKAGLVPMPGAEDPDAVDAPEDATISEPGEEVVPAEPALSAEEGDSIEAELQELLIVVKGDDDAREKFLELLVQLGPDDPRTNTYRRKLATALF